MKNFIAFLEIRKLIYVCDLNQLALECIENFLRTYNLGEKCRRDLRKKTLEVVSNSNSSRYTYGIFINSFKQLDFIGHKEADMILPCKHEAQVTKQVPPTIDLLANMDVSHPDILLEHNIQPIDYRHGLVFRSAIESIRGTFIASSTTGREGLIGDVLENMLQKGQIADYKQTGNSRRYDFIVVIERNPDYIAALEVKGGEGNSINISERPLWAKEFCVWCHLDGAIVNQPAHGAHSILNRLTNELVRRHKSVDALFFKDILCGTRTRPCPKYPDQEDRIGLRVAPDIFLFPERVPTLDDPEPPVHSLDTLKLPSQILDLFSMNLRTRDEHVWEVHVRLEELSRGRIQRILTVRHKGEVVDESRSRAWQP